MENEFDLELLEADGPFYIGKCTSLVIPTTDGSIGIQAHHYNMIAAIVPGTIKFTRPDGTRDHAAVSGGFLKVENNSVLILADSLERPEEIDRERAEEEYKLAAAELLEMRSLAEYKKAQAQMARAVNRLKVKLKYDNK